VTATGSDDDEDPDVGGVWAIACSRGTVRSLKQ
jgi:hypothetical protein